MDTFFPYQTLLRSRPPTPEGHPPHAHGVLRIERVAPGSVPLVLMIDRERGDVLGLATTAARLDVRGHGRLHLLLAGDHADVAGHAHDHGDRRSTRLNSRH